MLFVVFAALFGQPQVALPLILVLFTPDFVSSNFLCLLYATFSFTYKKQQPEKYYFIEIYQ